MSTHTPPARSDERSSVRVAERVYLMVIVPLAVALGVADLIGLI